MRDRIETALRRDLEHEMMQDRDRGSWEDGDIRAMTRFVLMSQRRSWYHAGGDEIKLEKERAGWVRVRVFEVTLTG